MFTIGDKIAELRKNRKMTQEELANIVGVSAQSVSKWENSQTMPDIMLLPTLASALDVTVNDLFSITPGLDCYEGVHPDKTPEYAYKELFKALQQGLCYGESFSKDSLSTSLESLRGDDKGQSGLISFDKGEMNGAVYVNRNIALSLVKPKTAAVSLFENDKIAEVLSVLSDSCVRRLLKYMLTNGNPTLTAAAASNKCGIDAGEAEIALNKLASLGLVRVQSVDTGEDKPLAVYHIIREHKIDMSVYPLFEIARILAEWHENWYGFRC